MLPVFTRIGDWRYSMYKNTKSHPQIGDIYLMEFKGEGSEQSGIRPGVIFQNNVGNANSPNVIALPLTSSLKKLHLPTHVLLKASETGLLRDSVVLCENPEKMSKERLGNKITTLSTEDMKRVAIGNLMATAAISFIDKNTLIDTWEKSHQLNYVS